MRFNRLGKKGKQYTNIVFQDFCIEIKSSSEPYPCDDGFRGAPMEIFRNGLLLQTTPGWEYFNETERICLPIDTVDIVNDEFKLQQKEGYNDGVSQ